jgi:putative tryptophan/tyrosine transport system substrate-binding protein
MTGTPMQRREFITLLGGAASAWPLAARAQQRERIRRIGVFLNRAGDDPEVPVKIATLLHGLSELGWNDRRNLRIDYRWGAGDTERYRTYAAELVALTPDVVLANGGAVVRALQQTSRAVPIVFVTVTDPVGGGLVTSLARPGGNTTGFILYEYSMSGKWLELLKQISPGVTRVAVVRDPTTVSGTGLYGAIQAAATTFRLEISPIDARNVGDIERAVGAFADRPNGGLIVTASGSGILHRAALTALAAQHKLPAVYSDRVFADSGGLISYGPDENDQYRRAASYVDRILKGEKPADLPVQAPTRYETVLNLKTAKALGLDVPATVLVRADEVIE